jgi:hypothetical protein
MSAYVLLDKLPTAYEKCKNAISSPECENLIKLIDQCIINGPNEKEECSNKFLFEKQ